MRPEKCVWQIPNCIDVIYIEAARASQLVYFDIFCFFQTAPRLSSENRRLGSLIQVYFECWCFQCLICHPMLPSLSGNMNAGACPTSLKYGWGTDVIFLLVASLVIFIQSCSVIYAIIHFYFIHLNNESMWVWIFIWWKEVFRALPNVTSVMEENWRLIQSHILEVTQISLFPYYWYIFSYYRLWYSIYYISICEIC